MKTAHYLLYHSYSALNLFTISSTISLFFQSSFHLSLTVLVRYRSLTNRYLASDGVYHLIKIFFKLHSQATWLVHKGSTGLRPRCLAIPSFIRFAYGSITLYSSFFQTKRRKPCWIPQSNQLVLRTWPFVYTTSLRSIPARRKFSAWARSFLFIRHYSGNHRYFLFPPLIKMLQFSGLLLFKLKYKNKYEIIRVFNFF